MFKIYTSYFAKAKKIPDDIVRISICGGVPKWYNGLQYKKVAPKYGFFNEWKKNGDNDYYIEHFNKGRVKATIRIQHRSLVNHTLNGT